MLTHLSLLMPAHAERLSVYLLAECAGAGASICGFCAAGFDSQTGSKNSFVLCGDWTVSRAPPHRGPRRAMGATRRGHRRRPRSGVLA